MGTGKPIWIGALLALPIVVVVCLLALSRREVFAPRGTELRCGNVAFKVLDVATADRVGAPGAERSARGLFRVVRLEVVNRTHAGGYDPAWHHALVVDASGEVIPLDAEATQVLRTAEGAPAAPARLAPGERFVTTLVYDVPSDASGLTLRIAEETAALLNLAEMVAHGDRRLLLDEGR